MAAGSDPDDPNEHPTPEYWWGDNEVEAAEVEYSIRGPDDWIISGPFDPAYRGRFFPTWEEAEAWAREKYGSRLKGRAHNHDDYWAFVIRGPRGKAV